MRRSRREEVKALEGGKGQAFRLSAARRVRQHSRRRPGEQRGQEPKGTWQPGSAAFGDESHTRQPPCLAPGPSATYALATGVSGVIEYIDSASSLGLGESARACSSEPRGKSTKSDGGGGANSPSDDCRDRLADGGRGGAALRNEGSEGLPMVAGDARAEATGCAQLAGVSKTVGSACHVMVLVGEV